MINIGLFQLHVAELAAKYNLKKSDLEILIYGSENPMFTQYQAMINVPCCRPSIIAAMKRLTTGGWVKIAVDRKPGVSRKHVISGKARSVITELNLLLGNA